MKEGDCSHGWRRDGGWREAAFTPGAHEIEAAKEGGGGVM